MQQDCTPKVVQGDRQGTGRCSRPRLLECHSESAIVNRNNQNGILTGLTDFEFDSSTPVGAQPMMQQGEEWSINDPALGTTIMAAKFDGGVVLAADSRTSSGVYIANRVSDKITRLHDKVYVCRSGSAADTQVVAQVTRLYIGLHSIDLEEEPEVKTAAHVLNSICYDNKNNLMAGMIVAGWDKRNKGKVYSIPLGGGIFEQEWTIGGSGSGYIYGYCDANWKENMSQAECIAFCKNAVSLAMSRDGSSGGVIRLVVINEQGAERHMVVGDDLPYQV